MHAIKSVCLLLFAAKRCFAALSTSLPPVSHSPYNSLQNTTNGTSVVVPESLAVALGMFGQTILKPNLATLRRDATATRRKVKGVAISSYAIRVWYVNMPSLRHEH